MAYMGNLTLNALYVGDLSQDITESILFNKFAAVGPVKSVRICRDTITKNSLGYAYVNFESEEDAQRAFDTLNCEILNARPMRIMWSQRDPYQRKSGEGNIFIKNLDKSIDGKSLYDTFSAFGIILSCKVSMDEEGKSKGFGFIQFKTEEEAQTAIEKVNGMLMCGKKVFVGKFKSKNEREKGNEIKVCENTDNFTNVFIKNFEDSLDEAQLYELFSKFGNIKSHTIMRREDGKSKGFGFVDFEDAFAAKASILELNDMKIDGKTLFVGRALKKSERKKLLETENSTCIQDVNLYVKHLDDSIDDDYLRMIFSPFGTITSAKVMKYDNNRSKGFGFVCFSSPEEATLAISEMNKRFVISKPLYVALALRKEDRKLQIATNFVKLMNSFNPMLQLNETFNMSNFSHPQRNFQPHITHQARWPHPPPQDHNVTQAVEALNDPSPMYPFTGPNRGQNAGPSSILGHLPSFPRNFNPTSMNRTTRPVMQPNPRRRTNTLTTSNSKPPQSSWLSENISSSLASSGVNTLSNQPLCIPKPVAYQYLHKNQENTSLSSFTEHIRPQTVTDQNNINGPSATEQAITSLHSANQIIASRPSFPNSATQATTFHHSTNQVTASRPLTIQHSIGFPHSSTQQAITPPSLEVITSNQEPLTMSILANASHQDRKRMLGNHLFPHIQKLYPEKASKITGMLLEINNEDLLRLLEDPNLIKEKADDAFSVLEAYRPAV